VMRTRHAPRLRFLLFIALAAGLGALTLIRKPESKVVVTYVRTVGIGEQWAVFAIRNDTGHPVTFAGFLNMADQNIWYDASYGSEIKPQSTGEIFARWSTENQPRSVYAYVVP